MDEMLKQVVFYALLPLLLSGVAYLMKNILDRLSTVEKETTTKLDELAVRRLLSDKIDPIREDIQEIQDKLDRLIDLLIMPDRNDRK